ncbi:hypothetical protein [Solirhodobacter olei]|uniref:COG4315 family predicted lipoprotein n=1 Tax=Solirhodobacter olei TaxID=2493082 RepID=UPI000FDA512C|nr:hypothetical protein [Solirhodobacter olei]
MIRHVAVVTALAIALPAMAFADPAMVMSSAKGKILTDAQGMALYTFSKDSKDKSACTGGCAALWPPLKASASDKATGHYSVFKRPDGTMQWAYEGKPLYTFVQDKKKADPTGDGFRGVWHVAKPAG